MLKNGNGNKIEQQRNKLAGILAGGLALSLCTGCAPVVPIIEPVVTEAPTQEVQTDWDHQEVEAPEEIDQILDIGYDRLDGRFHPMFAECDGDRAVADLVSVHLFETDRNGKLVLSGIKGETAQTGNTIYTYQGIADGNLQVAEDSATLDITLREDVLFSDGEKMTIDDVIFSMYVLADPTYDGPIPFAELSIDGMTEFRDGMTPKGELILEGGKENEDFTYYSFSEQDAFFNEAIPTAGEMLAKDIIDYIYMNYAETYTEYLAAYNYNDIAFAMFLWGYGSMNATGDGLIGAATGTEYALSDLSAGDFWHEMEAAYAGDYIMLANVEQASRNLWDILYETFPEYAAGVSTRDSIRSISGIEKTGAYSLRVSFVTFEEEDVLGLQIPVIPLHYYGDTALFDYDNESYGFTKGDLSLVRGKSDCPLGAGPFVFGEFTQGQVSLTERADYYLRDITKTKLSSVHVAGYPADGMLEALSDGTLDVCEFRMWETDLYEINERNANEALCGDVLWAYVEADVTGEQPEDTAEEQFIAGEETLVAVCSVLTVDTEQIPGEYTGAYTILKDLQKLVLK